MTTYPGESPPDGEQPSDSGTEPTQPVGYWERQAAERAGEQGQAPQDRPDPTTPYPEGYPQSGPGAVFNPTSAQNPYGPSGPQYGSQQYGYPPAPGQAGPYPYPPASGGVPGSYGVFSPPLPDHPQATLALVLGLVGLVGAFVLCGVTLVVSPFAWAVGHNALKQIDAAQGRLGGRSNAQAGMVLGIIGTVLLMLAILAVVAFVVLVVASETTGSGSSV